MKNTLEYKILKHLSENKDGDYKDISDIENNIDFLKSVIKDLKSRELIETNAYPEIPWNKNIGFVGSTPSEKPEKCKIKLYGIEYLYNLEKSQVDFELAKKTLKEFPKTKWFARIGLIIAIILLLKELYLWLIK